LLNDEDRKALQLNKFEQTMTLYELQDKIKRQPDMYKNEFMTHFRIFQEKLKDFKTNPARKDVPLMDYLKFLSHISNVYPQHLPQFLSTEMLNLLQQYHSILNPELRMTLVTSLKIMRGKDNVQAVVVLPVFFKLFRCKDKPLRKFLHGSLIGDLKDINKSSKNHAVNKTLQNFVLSLL
jgi:protein SDA1